jgi:hypothetical protein
VYFPLRCRLVERHRLPLLDAERPGGTDCQTEASPIAQFIADNPRFAVHDLNGPLGTRGDTQPATVAQLLVNAYNLAFDHRLSIPLDLFSKDDLVRQGDSALGTQVLAIAAVGTVLRVHDDRPFVYQGHGFRRTSVHTGTTTVAEFQVDLRQHALFNVHYHPP